MSTEGAAGTSARGALRTGVGLVDDAVLLLLVAWAGPIAILLLGMPLMLSVRFLLEIAQRM
jgi:hypothetical protein